MKALVFFLLLTMGFNAFGQTTQIPDPNFEQALIDLGIDSDGTLNGQVLTTDIQDVITLELINKRIEDLTGVEGFASLENLDVTNNILSSLDLSNNIQIRELICSNWDGFANMNITSLNLSNNINLESLYAENLFLLEELNLKNGHNAILNVHLSCDFEGTPCQLTELDCVKVDDAVAATNNEAPYNGWYIAADFIYSEDCILGVSEFGVATFSIYPNPANNEIFLTSDNTSENITLKIYNVQGKLLSTKILELQEQNSAVDVSRLKSGIYLLNIEDENGNTEIKKFIKE